jgi:uncharacterized membrane protein YoaK (UPF0700 family)
MVELLAGETQRMQSSVVVLAGALAAIAGFVDAVGYLQFSRLFVSFMSGNTTVLGIHAADAEWAAAAQPAMAIGGFVLGTFVGTLITEPAGRWAMPAVLGLEAALLAAALAAVASGVPPALSLLPITVAMGMQNIPLPRIGETRVAMTYVTGALVNLGRMLGQIVQRRASWRPSLTHALLWGALLCGAIAGGLTHGRIGILALAVPAVLLALIGTIMAAAVWRDR